MSESSAVPLVGPPLLHRLYRRVETVEEYFVRIGALAPLSHDLASSSDKDQSKVISYFLVFVPTM
eukprot:SAG31_NODE_201_length_20535_cov_15.315081_18_plen_65_part_00